VVKHSESKHLISHNVHNSTYRFKRTTCVELCPVCRDDLVFLPPKIAQALGGLPPVVLCIRAASVVGLLDPASGRSLEVSPADYWKRPFFPAVPSTQMTEFIVLDVTPVDHGAGGGRSATVKTTAPVYDIEIARAADFGVNEERLMVRSHLGNLLQPSDVVLGYDLRTANAGLDDEDLAKVPMDVYLVRKQRPEKAARRSKKPVGAHNRKSRPSKQGVSEGAQDAVGIDRTSSRAVEGASAQPGDGDEKADAEEAEYEDDEEDEEDEDSKELAAAAVKMLDAFNAPSTGEGQSPFDGEVVGETTTVGEQPPSLPSSVSPGPCAAPEAVDVHAAPGTGAHGDPIVDATQSRRTRADRGGRAGRAARNRGATPSSNADNGVPNRHAQQ